MIHAADCKCRYCLSVYSNGDWVVAHKYGDVHVELQKTALTPASALSLATTMEHTARQAIQWRDSQTEAAGITPTPPTQRSHREDVH